jgi:5-formyltetrahydrofolate cyclo-ligase
MKNKTKLWRDIGAKRGALARQYQEAGDKRNAFTLRQNIRQTKHFMQQLMNNLPSQLMQGLLLRAGVVQKREVIA